MSTYTHLVSGGCSFTTCFNSMNWPVYLSDALGTQLVDTAHSSQGNAQIARQVVHAVSELLDSGVDPSDMFVGIVWSGLQRTDFFRTDIKDENFSTDPGGEVSGFPVVNMGTITDGCWLILNPGFTGSFAEQYYYDYHTNLEQGAILSFEKMHWVQNFLEHNNIDYFMSTYTDEVFEHGLDNINVKSIQKLVNTDKFLPVRSYYRFAFDCGVGPEHPNRQQSRKFVNDVILPFIGKNYSHKL